mgnify:FL=1
MKVEYVTSPIGGGTELYISAAEYKRVNSKDGWSDRQNLIFAVRSYTQTNQSRKLLLQIRVQKKQLKKRQKHRPQKKLQQKSLLKTRRRLKKNLKTVAKQSTLKLFQETLTSTKVMTTSLKVRLFRFRKAGAIRLT